MSFNEVQIRRTPTFHAILLFESPTQTLNTSIYTSTAVLYIWYVFYVIFKKENDWRFASSLNNPLRQILDVEHDWPDVHWSRKLFYFSVSFTQRKEGRRHVTFGTAQAPLSTK